MTETGRHPILVVDDEADILFSLRDLLRRDFDVHTAESGAEALDVLRRHAVHVLMSDQRMPGMTGVELLAQVRQEWPDTVRLVFTGYADLKAVVDAVNRAEIYRYLTKPCDPEDLHAILAGACRHFESIAQRHQLLADVREHLAREGGQRDEAAAALLTRLDRVLSERE